MKSSEKKINFGDKRLYINKWGQVILQNKKNKNIFATTYNLENTVDIPTMFPHDTVTLIDETDGRVIGIKPKSYFLETDWIPILPEEYKQIKRNYSEITSIRRDFNLNKIL